MTVTPYYSLVRGLALEDLWHNNDECEIGLSVGPLDRRRGRSYVWKHCPYCKVLNERRYACTSW
jgi:hypothetical protein